MAGEPERIGLTQNEGGTMKLSESFIDGLLVSELPRTVIQVESLSPSLDLPSWLVRFFTEDSSNILCEGEGLPASILGNK